MAKFIRCPRCQTQMDVTSVAAGATLRCTDCGGMLRVPTGQTGVRQAVSAPVAAAPQSSSGGTKVRTGGRQTDLFRKMSGARTPGGSKPPSRSSVDAEMRGGTRIRSKGASNGVIAAIAAGGALVLIVVLVLFVNSQKANREQERLAREVRNAQIRKDNEERALKAYAERDAEEKAEKAAEKEAKASAKKDSSLKKKAGGGYDVPANFEPGARKWAKEELLKVDEALTKEYEAMAAGGAVDVVLKDIGKWMPCVVNGLVSDAEAVARGSFKILSQFCVAKNITTESGKNPISLEYLNSAAYRGGDFNFWVDWWGKPQNKVALGAGTAKDLEEIRTKGPDPAQANWEEMMKYLRFGGGFDDPTRPEGKAFAQVKSMGRGAYPHLINYITHEELPIAKAAVTVLNALTGRQGQMPTEATKAQVKSEWEAWLKNN